LSLSNFFNSENECLNPDFSLSKKFDSDSECLTVTLMLKFVEKFNIYFKIIDTDVGIFVPNPLIVVLRHPFLASNFSFNFIYSVLPVCFPWLGVLVSA
jgi:hypothetical protein